MYENGADSLNVTNSEFQRLRYVYENGADSSNVTNSEFQRLRYVYKNGADSSNLTFPWPRSELTIQAPNEFGLNLKVPSPQLLVRKRFIMVAANEVEPVGRWTRRGLSLIHI